MATNTKARRNTNAVSSGHLATPHTVLLEGRFALAGPVGGEASRLLASSDPTASVGGLLSPVTQQHYGLTC
ncbi:hypothetical protein BN381_20078 [Candidatus Microthrix parvicella RN1]|uniref:Uncharacterized protein n=1 Tax=Candidatus Neomicrothrix parvicella RN1 TaxID=1229780 RepID=R4YXR7_9ACTN|nr:hypothetical protein BN381_20078 [Candidatus Microthrix parvicella RN1]